MSQDWRASLFARRTLGVRLGTASLAAVLDRLLPGLRERPPFSVTQIVGTNGKGSSAALLDHGLRRSSLGPVGLYTSPHLLRVGERVRIDGEAIDDEEIRAGVEAVARAEAAAGVSLSFFEVLSAVALDRFVAAGCRHVVLEAGLGGRLDATSAVAREQVLISRIALDHQHFLGDSIAAIAAEKAAVIVPGVPVASVEQLDQARAVIEQVASQRGAPLSFVAPLEREPIGLLGEHQRHNAALALAGLRRLVPEARIEHLDGVRWPGRLERRTLAGGELWLDVAHNLDGVEALCAAVAQLGIRPAVIVFGAMADKPAPAMAERLRTLGPLWLVPPAAEGAHELEALALPGDRRFAGPADPALLEDLHERLTAGERVLVCGSHFLVGALTLALEGSGAGAPEPGDPLPRG
ncbi:MAG: bifunctional folylpolyglutamate synthase/dihydrofolate synthase [Enhygromyxa sp.]